MKKLSNGILILSFIAMLPACNDEKKENVETTTKDSSAAVKTDTSVNTPPATSDQMVDQDTKDFVMKAASGGMMEVELGKIAQEKAHNKRVKDYADMLVADHTKANDDLKSIASSKVTMPAAMMPDEQKHVDMMKNKSGADFDKSYINMMIEDHKKDIAEFKKASQNLKDAGVKGFATNALPVLQKHLDSAQAIHGSKM